MSKDVNGRIGILMWVLGAMVTIQAAVNGWTVTQIIAFNTGRGEEERWTVTQISAFNARISKMEANLFTAQDGLDVWKEINNIRAGMK
jgi:hypothetical protein